MALCLEGSSRNLVVHGMEGFDYQRARIDLQIPEEYQVEAMAAIGKKAAKEKLPEELQKREVPGPRKPVSAFIKVGKFAF